MQQHAPGTPPLTAEGSLIVLSIFKLIDGFSVLFLAPHSHVFNTVTPSASVGFCYPELQLFVLLIHFSPFISFWWQSAVCCWILGSLFVQPAQSW